MSGYLTARHGAAQWDFVGTEATESTEQVRENVHYQGRFVRSTTLGSQLAES